MFSEVSQCLEQCLEYGMYSVNSFLMNFKLLQGLQSSISLNKDVMNQNIPFWYFGFTILRNGRRTKVTLNAPEIPLMSFMSFNFIAFLDIHYKNNSFRLATLTYSLK